MMKLKVKIMLLPFIPLVSAAMHHYFPDWITDGYWFISSLLGMIAVGVLIAS